MIIREMVAKDKAAYIEMGHKFYDSPAVLHKLPEEIYEKNFAEMISFSPYIKGYIIEDDGVQAGYMILSYTFSAEVGGTVVLIEELFLDDNARGKGIGTKALEFVRNQYPNAARFRLEVTQENEGAIRLYERMGFTMLEYRQMIVDFTENN